MSTAAELLDGLARVLDLESDEEWRRTHTVD
jgi:hypothetical protein